MISGMWLAGLIGSLALGVTAPDGPKTANPFFAMDTCMKQRYPASDLTIDQQLDLVKELGYDGLSWTQGDNADLRAAADGAKKRGLKLFAHYAGATLRKDRLELEPGTEQALDLLKGTGAILWLHVGSPDFARSSPEGDAVAVAALRALAEMAAARGIRVALYPHVGEWVERVQDAIRVADKVGRPNLGVTFNLCHCLKMGDETRIPELLRAANPRLFAVTINGADTGVPEAGWDRLIQTLDRGSMDLKPLLRTLSGLHYDGPIGLQGFGWRGEVRDNLARSIAAWRRLDSAAHPAAVWTGETRDLRMVVATDGTVAEFSSRAGKRNYAASGAPLARVRSGGKEYAATSARLEDGTLRLAFGNSGIEAVIRPEVRAAFVRFDVVSAKGDGCEAFTFVDIPLTLKGEPGEPFAACALALNLRTNVDELPRPNSRLRAVCYPKFGFSGAAAALIGCPPGRLRSIMKQVVREAPELPKSAVGGPWALDGPNNRGSYLFNFGGMSEHTVDRWIALARRLGMTQIDFHGGNSFRFGDCAPNPQTYPRGRDSFKAVIDRLHAAGIKAGLHTYAFFIDKRCPWVTPVPDRRLAKDATFTLAADLPAADTRVPVTEPTTAMTTTTGFFVWNSVTVQIDDELITYSGVQKEAPYAFTGCTRGALGTKVAAHRRGAKVHHLKECFGLFVPDPETTLFEEVAAKTAEMYNACGFDMIYLDALDGEGILGGPENAWHYGSRFVFEICKRLKKPALMEMSTFHHHLWYVRSRMGAWDHPTRSHKQFVDIHCKANEDCARMFLPGQLGWWAVKTWSGAQGEPTFSDDMEYLLGKCIGTGNGFALMGIDPDTIEKVPALARIADLVRRYEEIRLSGKVPTGVKARLAKPGEEYSLIGDLKSGWHFEAARYDRHKVEGPATGSETWTVTNPYGSQPLRIRIEALLSAAPTSSTTRVVADPSVSGEFAAGAVAPGISATLAPSPEKTPDGRAASALKARDATAAPRGSWAQFQKTFATPVDLRATQALGIWVRGDGSGAVLNVQLRCPSHVVAGIGEHYIPIDFTGWRYCELVEPEGSRYADYAWPYGDPYSIYRESTDFGQVGSVGLWINNVPAGKETSILVGPVLALPLAPEKIVNPTIVIGGKALAFQGEIPSGGYLEYAGSGPARIYGPQGEPLREVVPQGEALLASGSNRIEFRCEAQSGVRPRARVTIGMRGPAVR